MSVTDTLIRQAMLTVYDEALYAQAQLIDLKREAFPESLEMSPTYLKEYRTIRLGGPRQTGATTWVLKRLRDNKENALVLTVNSDLAEHYEEKTSDFNSDITVHPLRDFKELTEEELSEIPNTQTVYIDIPIDYTISNGIWANLAKVTRMDVVVIVVG